MLADALLLQLGYNATLVALGAALLGIAAGVAGTFLFLRKRALVSDAISHATLPGVGLAFVVMAAMGGYLVVKFKPDPAPAGHAKKAEVSEAPKQG